MKCDVVSGGFATEMTDEQLETIYGGGGSSLGVVPSLGAGPASLAPSLGAALSASSATSERIHSFSVLCDINIFSLNALVLPIINIAVQTTQACANND